MQCIGFRINFQFCFILSTNLVHSDACMRPMVERFKNFCSMQHLSRTKVGGIAPLQSKLGARAPAAPLPLFLCLCIYCVSVNQPGNLDLWPLKLVRFIVRGVGNIPINFGVSVTLLSRLMGQQLSRITWPGHLDLWGHDACPPTSTGLCIPSVYQVSSSYAFPYGICDALPVSSLVQLVTLTSDLETGAHYCPWGATILPILVFLWRFVLDLAANTCQTRHVNLRPWPCRSWRLSLMRVLVLRLCTKFQVRRPFRSEDMMHFRSHH